MIRKPRVVVPKLFNFGQIFFIFREFSLCFTADFNAKKGEFIFLRIEKSASDVLLTWTKLIFILNHENDPHIIKDRPYFRNWILTES